MVETTVSAKLQSLEDPELMTRAAGGDEGALEVLYARHSGRVRSVALRRLGNAQDAEDIVQEVFLELWNRAGKYESERSSVGTLLYLITRCRSEDRARLAYSRRRMNVNTDQFNSLQGTVDPRNDVGHTDTVLSELIARLPHRLRATVEMVYLKEMTTSDVAAALDVPQGTVKSRLRLARELLRGWIDESDIEETP
jgi:RNA polymerase sigma-70 factor (ECF subfamily)